jgi:hypothetical protein
MFNDVVPVHVACAKDTSHCEVAHTVGRSNVRRRLVVECER